jgi:hypothetical protein
VGLLGDRARLPSLPAEAHLRLRLTRFAPAAFAEVLSGRAKIA